MPAIVRMTSGSGGTPATRVSVDGAALSSLDIDSTGVVTVDGNPIAGFNIDSTPVISTLTQAEYDALTSRDATTLYLIGGAFGVTRLIYNGQITELGGTGSGGTGTAAYDAAIGYSGTLRGAWTGATAYSVGDVVTAEAGLFRCVTAHTSNGSGFRFDREKWQVIPIPVLAAGATVPVRQLLLTNPGVGSANPPQAGIFQRRPRQFDYSRQKLLYAFTNTTACTGSTITLTNGTAPGGSVVSVPTGNWTLSSSALTTPVDLTGSHLRVLIKLTSQPAGANMNIDITSSGTAYANYHTARLLTVNTDLLATGIWQMISIPITAFTAVGTGAALSSIDGVRLRRDTAGNVEFEIAAVTYHPNPTGKAKVVFWFDDGGLSSHVSAVQIAQKYGFPVTLAYVAANYVISTSGINADQARLLQDYRGCQIAVHAFADQDHNRPQTDAVIFEQMLDYQHFGQAMGMHGVGDMAYWSSGFNSLDSTKELTVRKLFRSARGGVASGGETLPPGNPINTRAMMTSTSQTATVDWIPYVQKVIAFNGLAQFVWHDMPAGSLTEFTALCQWISDNRSTVEVVTAAGAFDPYCVG